MSKLLQVPGLPRIWATRPEFPFGPKGAQCRAFLVQRPLGNVWIYASSFVSEYMGHIQELGGVSRQLLNHRDEASAACNELSAPLFCHALEKSAIEAKGSNVKETFSGAEHLFGDDLKAYHTPGHAVGVTSYHLLLDSKTSVLFTGDSLYGKSSDQLALAPTHFHPYDGQLKEYHSSLELVKKLQPTFVIPGLGFSEQMVYPFKANDIDSMISNLEKRM